MSTKESSFYGDRLERILIDILSDWERVNGNIVQQGNKITSGLCDMDGKVITLDQKHLDSFTRRNALVHEVLHAWLLQREIPHTEEEIESYTEKLINRLYCSNWRKKGYIYVKSSYFDQESQ